MSRTKQHGKTRGQIRYRGKDTDGIEKWLIRSRSRREGKSVIVSKIVHGSHAVAMLELAERLINPQAAKPAQKKSVEKTFQDYYQDQWTRYTGRKWKASTVITMGCGVTKHILPHFGTMALSEIRPADIESFHGKMEAKGLSPSTRRNLHGVLSRMFSYAVDTLELIVKSPMRKGLAPPRERIEKPTLSAQQLEQLLQTVDIRHRAFFMTLALTGVRCSEALGLKWQDLDFGERVIHVRRAISRGRETTPKTKGSLRDRPMVPRLYQSLLHHKSMSAYVTPESYVFSSSSGRPANSDQLREHLQATLEKIGIAFQQKRADGLHLLRHSGASLLYMATGNVKLTQSFLGHATSKITMDTYVHAAQDEAQKASEALQQAIFTQPAVPAGPAN
ncbi:MAG: tyrosine-type recombinase/integrase [Terriglobales bacterium]